MPLSCPGRTQSLAVSVPARSRRRNASFPLLPLGACNGRGKEKRHREEVTIDAATSMERQAGAAVRARQGGPGGAGPLRGGGRGGRSLDRQQGAAPQRGGEGGQPDVDRG